MRRNFKVKRHASRGMTLVELLLVMAILSVVMMAVISLYIPVHQSTVSQTQVSDVQDNLRLALKTMTRDLLTAGFLMPYDPIIFPDATSPTDFHATNLTSPGTQNPSSFIIRTRAVGNGFARVSALPISVSGGFRLTVSDSEMVENFSVGSKVRLFEPVSGTEIKNEVYTVMAPLGTNTIDITGGTLLISDILVETVIIRVPDATTPALQTVQYSLSDGALQRSVNGDVHYLARNVDTDPANSSFAYDFTPEGRVKWVRVRLTGKTDALKDDAISGEKRRAIETSVKLRNIN